METVLSRLRGLSEDELRQELARADLKFGPITATTRAIFERKLAKVLAGPESGATETDGPSGAGASGGPGADRSDPVTCAVAVAAVGRGPPPEAGSVEADFGYGSGLNPPEEEEIPAPSRTGSSSSEDGPAQPRTETPSKASQVSPTFFYGVCPLWEDVLARNERPHVYTDKKDALQVVKMIKGARFKAFPSREDAEKFAKGMCDYFPSPSKSTSCGPVMAKDNTEVDAINRERANSFKSPRTQDLTAKLRKSVEKGDESTFNDLIWSNPRYLIGSGDNPTIVQEGCRYNVMHVAAKENQAGMAQLLLDTLEDPKFMRLMYPDDQEHMLQRRIRYIVDLYLNTPDKGGYETPLHFACKFGCPDVVNVLCSHPDVDKNRKNKYDQKPCEVICDRKNKTQEVKQKILDYLEDRCYVPLMRATDNSSQPVIGAPWSPEPSESFSNALSPRHARSPMDPLMSVKAFAGPLSPSKADEFRRAWKTPPRDRAEQVHHILKSDPDRGVERVGRNLAHEFGHAWAEYWDFLDCFVDLASQEGLRKFEDYLGRKDFRQRAHEEAGENETRNRFRTPSPGKPKKFCNSISVGAFLDEGDDLSREEMKNRQNAALTSISSAAGARDRRGADLIETAAEVDLLCGGEGLLLSPGGAAACGIELCASPLASGGGGGGGRDGTPNGDTASCSRLSPSSSAMLLLSPVSDLTLEFEHMSLGGSAGGGGVRERRSSGGGRHRELRDSSSSSSPPPAPLAAAQLSCGLGRLSLGRAEDEGQPAGGKRCSGGSSSSEEFLEAQENLDGPLGQRTRGADSGRTLCARSKSWDHGGRDLSSSGSSGSYKSFNSSNEFLSRTPPPPRIRKSLFIEGDVPTKLDSEVLLAIEAIDVSPQQFPGIHKWKSTMQSYSKSDMQSWPSPAVVKHRPRMPPHTPSSPASGMGPPAGRFSPARLGPSTPDFSPGRYSPAHASSLHRIRLKHFNPL
ncbi:ankyrin repeat and LEM domain-containing protein 2 [Gadus chalcogrammus]|uniref:ankyrin repeat and LEM domain-containing protein 2 n=1 Tax=Gadus chalcogrammus TaxID=1042646 RepID=UPI0024C316F5|nr:ankyrin repeat and LEM domain-containing protein 2 [Gadus chalcogrammus]XP_056448018.1 ankyrin repeat and LEM domain-containing protein 2 [Gadus chalcogrammus]XP_056448019.1 ankyrin repeat and LEM domain-containing protein 2 [Gadus chalcogrammus]XP_056448020.1 ankyrin repeat and LEM domain-containing protein 2 [Gadus chalcogrammus]